MNLLVTGASGFVGRALTEYIRGKHHSVISLVRQKPVDANVQEVFIEIGDISKHIDWSNVLNDIQVVVHTAARAHVLKDTSTNPLAEFRKTNVNATVNLAKAAIKS